MSFALLALDKTGAVFIGSFKSRNASVNDVDKTCSANTLIGKFVRIVLIKKPKSRNKVINLIHRQAFFYEFADVGIGH
ncbi:hypothetical protein D3C87_1558480 [compost metagenome]